jgi:hypothetical protein
MLPRLLIALVVLFCLWLALRWLSKAPPSRIRKAAVAGGLALLVAAGLFLTATGRLAGLVAVAVGLAPWAIRVLRLHALWRTIRGLGNRDGKNSGQRTQGGGASSASTSSAMTRDEAWQVLGLPPGASADDIRAAHRRLMRTAHPDVGGSSWLAARLNQARDILLG